MNHFYFHLDLQLPLLIQVCSGGVFNAAFHAIADLQDFITK
jgi:hypothetical protein